MKKQVKKQQRLSMKLLWQLASDYIKDSEENRKDYYAVQRYLVSVEKQMKPLKP